MKKLMMMFAVANAAAMPLTVDAETVDEDVYVEYVQSDRTKSQAVNIGYRPNPNTKLVVDYAFVDTTNVQQRVFGVSGSTGGVNLQHYINGSCRLAYTCNNNTSAGWWTLLPATQATNDRRTFILDMPANRACVLQGGDTICQHTYSNRVTNTANHTLAIFACHNASDNITSNNYYSSVKFYSMQIYESDVLVMDLWPCKSDGVYCIKDRLSGNKFFEVNGKALAGGAEIVDEPSVEKNNRLQP